MIQYWLKDQIQAALPNVEVTVEYEPNVKEYVTVFYEGGAAPDSSDLNGRRPNYMVWVQSPDYGYAEYLAEQVFDLLHNWHKQNGQPIIPVEYYRGNELLRTERVQLQKLISQSEPNRIGVEDRAMQYTVNLTATILPKGETVHE